MTGYSVGGRPGLELNRRIALDPRQTRPGRLHRRRRPSRSGARGRVLGGGARAGRVAAGGARAVAAPNALVNPFAPSLHAVHTMSTAARVREPTMTTPRRSPFSAVAKALVALLTAATLGACGSADDGVGGVTGETAGNSPFASAPPSSGLAVPLPAAVLASRSVDRDALEARVTLGDGRTREAVRRGEAWEVSVVVPRGEPVSLLIEWFERIGERLLPIARLTREVGPLETNATVAIDPTLYDSDSLDEDGDQRSNLDERNAGTDPYVADSVTDDGDPPQPDPGDDSVPAGVGDGRIVDVRITPAPGEGVPTIDGSFNAELDGTVWPRGQFADVNGRELLIDRLLAVDPEAIDRIGVDTQDYKWLAMHDYQSLYLIVLFEGSGDEQSPVREDGPFFQDDGLHLFIDGDNSRATGLAPDDLYLFLPLLPRPGEDAIVATAEFDSAPFVPEDLDYAACPCPGGVTGWEIRIGLEAAGIEFGRPFGIELQLDQDLDGGDREARWGWANPPLDQQGEDFGFESPAFNGTAVLVDQP